MTRMPSAVSWSVGLLLSWAALACEPGGVGDPCTPEDEYQQDFNGFQVTETNVESRSFQCATRLCLVNHFQGRVSCRVGQTAAQATPTDPTYHPVCAIPGTEATNDVPGAPPSKDNVLVEVPPQLQGRQTEQAVYCSCRCDGPDKNARYCECPEGFQCESLVDNLKITSDSGQLAGSYCIRNGSKYNPIDHFKGASACRAENCDDWCAKQPPNTTYAGGSCDDFCEQEHCGCDTSNSDYPSECGRKPLP